MAKIIDLIIYIFILRKIELHLHQVYSITNSQKYALAIQSNVFLFSLDSTLSVISNGLDKLNKCCRFDGKICTEN